MIEAQLRAKRSRIAARYDRMPYPVQNFLTSARGLVFDAESIRSGNVSYLRELRRHEKWSTEEISRFQLNAIQGIVDHARRTVPYDSDYPQIAFKSPASCAIIRFYARSRQAE